MKECIKCNAKVATQKKQCPVCFNELEKIETPSKQPQMLYNMAKYKGSSSNQNAFLTRLFLFLTISVASICLFINFMVDSKILWSLVVISSMVYVWVTVRHTIISRRGTFEKILFQFIGVLGVTLCSNMIAGGQDWFWKYIFPSSSIAAAAILSFVLLFNKQRSDFVASFFLMSVFFIILSTVMLLIDVEVFRLLYFISMLYNSLFTLAILIFGFKSLKREFVKTFHL